MRSICLLLCTAILTSCAGKIGPRAIEKDCINYNKAYQNSNDQQLLLNLVRLRYRDTPAFLQVGVMSSAYELKRSVSTEVNESFPDVFKVGADLTDKPTTTYSPVRGKGFSEELLQPIKFESLLLLNSSGWRIDRLMRICVQRMNGLRNAPTASGPTPSHVPEYLDFKELMEIFRELEESDGINIVVERHSESGRPVIVLMLEPSLAYSQQHDRIWNLLDVDPGTYHIHLKPYHGQERAGNEVLVDTRSPLSLMYFLSQGVNVPSIDEQCGRVTLTLTENNEYFDWNEVLEGLMRVRSIKFARPEKNCSVRGTKVSYRGRLFYIDDRDLDSKATFSLLSQLFALQAGCPVIPALTIPLN